MPATPGPAILVVDHDPRTACATANLLTRSGYYVVVACDCRSAVALAAEHLLAAAVLDPMGHSCDGFELAARVRAACPNLLLVAVTGWRGSEVSRWLNEAGFTTVLFRPARPEALLDALRVAHPPQLPTC